MRIGFTSFLISRNVKYCISPTIANIVYILNFNFQAISSHKVKHFKQWLYYYSSFIDFALAQTAIYCSAQLQGSHSYSTANDFG